MIFDCVDLPKKKKLVAYDAPDGRLEILKPNGQLARDRSWFINNAGQRCFTSPDWSEPKCFDLYETRDGVYHQYLDGRHVYILLIFRNGNRLSNDEAVN